MSNGGPPPACDLACQTKMILNSGNVRGITDANYEALKRFTDSQFQALNGPKVIEILNRMEDDAVKVQKMITKGAAYTGPTGEMLQD